MKNIFPTLFMAVVLFADCSSDKTAITNFSDYSHFLTGSSKASLTKIDGEIAFWSKRFETSNDDIVSRAKIASLLSRRFSYSGNIHEIHQADSLLQLVNAVNRHHSSATYRSLAANSITQHKFLQAQAYIDSALALGDDKLLTMLMDFDVSMELGNNIRARQTLNALPNKNAFEYLIRESKYMDHVKGDLPAAIKLMEQAYETIRNGASEETKLWALSNLADMYGHANEYRKSYRLYLEVLEKDPAYYHALKGIAWLAYSRDRNSKDALTIVQFLLKQHPVPDYHLLLAEIADFEKQTTEKDAQLEAFLKGTGNVMYGDMYNKYIFNLQAFELKNTKAALEIAQKEVVNRPTSEAFSWLAWAYLMNGQKEKAIETVRYHVEDKCFEPEVLLTIGKIYLAVNEKGKAKKFLGEAAESGYELGPLAEMEISELLKQL